MIILDTDTLTHYLMASQASKLTALNTPMSQSR
jgi:hypothetical protein